MKPLFRAAYAHILCITTLFFCSLNASENKRLFNKANKAYAKGHLRKAIKSYRRIIKANNELPHMYFNLGIALAELQELPEAIEAFETALILKADYTKAAFHLGKTHQASGNIAQAINLYERTLQLDPDCIDALTFLAALYNSNDQRNEAIALYQRAIALQPHNIQILLDLANTLNMNRQADEALFYYHELLSLLPDSTTALYNIAYTLKKLNRLEEALVYYEKVIERNPHHAEAHFSYALALLLTSNKHAEHWSRGWQEYEWRWLKQEHHALRQYRQPLWDGGDLHGKTLFIWCEQSLSDTLQFIRYAQVAKTMGAQKVIVAVQDSLQDLIKLCPYIDSVISVHDRPPMFDVHAPLLSMPHLTKTHLERTPCCIPYLFSDRLLSEQRQEQLSADKNFKIGICWQDNPQSSNQFLRIAAATKSMPNSLFAPLTHISGVSVYSLQTDTEQTLSPEGKFIFFDEPYNEPADRIMKTAALIEQLDLVISVDTFVSHLAAGLGVPTWNLLATPPDWRWMLDCDSTPWYPNMRLFRQPHQDDWESVMNEVIAAVTDHPKRIACLETHSQPA